MKQLIPFFVALISSNLAHAEFVIDDFSHASTVLNAFVPVPGGGPAVQTGFAVAGGTRTTTVAPGAKITFGGGSFDLETQGAGGTANITYTLSSALNLSAVGTHPNPLLFLDLFGSMASSFNVDVTIGSTTAASTFSFPTRNVSSPPFSSQPQAFPGTAAPPLLASTVDSISITFTQVAPGAFGKFNKSPGGAKISANPEPASLALLGMTGLGGWFMARRRGKKSEVAA